MGLKARWACPSGSLTLKFSPPGARGLGGTALAVGGKHPPSRPTQRLAQSQLVDTVEEITTKLLCIYSLLLVVVPDCSVLPTARSGTCIVQLNPDFRLSSLATDSLLCELELFILNDATGCCLRLAVPL